MLWRTLQQKSNGTPLKACYTALPCSPYDRIKNSCRFCQVGALIHYALPGRRVARTRRNELEPLHWFVDSKQNAEHNKQADRKRQGQASKNAQSNGDIPIQTCRSRSGQPFRSLSACNESGKNSFKLSSHSENFAL